MFPMIVTSHGNTLSGRKGQRRQSKNGTEQPGRGAGPDAVKVPVMARALVSDLVQCRLRLLEKSDVVRGMELPDTVSRSQ